MKNTKHAIYTILIILGSIASIVFYFYIFSLIQRNNVSAKNLDLEIKKIEEQKHVVRDIKKQIEDTKDIREILNQHLLTSSDIVRFFDALETESKIAKLKFSIVSAKEIAKGEPFQFELRTVGSYADNYHFLKILEALPYNLKFVDYALRYSDNLQDQSISAGVANTISGWEMNVSLELLLKD